jgi:hypothetical protein
MGNNYVPATQNQGSYTSLPGMRSQDPMSMYGGMPSMRDAQSPSGGYGYNPVQQSGLPQVSSPGTLASNGSQNNYQIPSQYLQQMNAPGYYSANAQNVFQGIFDHSQSYNPGVAVTGFNVAPFQSLAAPGNTSQGWSSVANQFQQGMDAFSAWQQQMPGQNFIYDQQNSPSQWNINTPGYQASIGKLPWNLDPSQVAPVLQNTYQDAYNNYAATGAFGVPNSGSSTQTNSPGLR